jgi:hypothetical protein
MSYSQLRREIAALWRQIEAIQKARQDSQFPGQGLAPEAQDARAGTLETPEPGDRPGELMASGHGLKRRLSGPLR